MASGIPVRQLTSITNTTETTIATAGGSGVRINCIGIIIANAHATQAAKCTIRDATGGGGACPVIEVPAGDTRGFMLPRALEQTTANSAWTLQSDASATLSVFFFGERGQ